MNNDALCNILQDFGEGNDTDAELSLLANFCETVLACCEQVRATSTWSACNLTYGIAYDVMLPSVVPCSFWRHRVIMGRLCGTRAVRGVYNKSSSDRLFIHLITCDV